MIFIGVLLWIGLFFVLLGKGISAAFGGDPDPRAEEHLRKHLLGDDDDD